MKLNELEILEGDFDPFVALDDANKIEFLFDASQQGIEAAALTQCGKLADAYIDQEPIVSVQDLDVGTHRLCITQYPNAIHFNSDSIKAIRGFVKKLINDGILLKRIPAVKTEYDEYRFLRVYEIIGKTSPLSGN